VLSGWLPENKYTVEESGGQSRPHRTQIGILLGSLERPQTRTRSSFERLESRSRCSRHEKHRSKITTNNLLLMITFSETLRTLKHHMKLQTQQQKKRHFPISNHSVPGERRTEKHKSGVEMYQITCQQLFSYRRI